MFLPSLPGASYSSENPLLYEFPPPLLSSFSWEREKRESRDIGEFPVNGTSPMIGAHKMRKRKIEKRQNLRLLMLGLSPVSEL